MRMANRRDTYWWQRWGRWGRGVAGMGGCSYMLNVGG